VDLLQYQNGYLIKEAGAIGAGDMTVEATVVKLMHLVGYYPDDLEKVRELLSRSIAGEISEMI
jgi:L-asparaginase/Glu-tRNA(Gln) amidotransferase subunit D